MHADDLRLPPHSEEAEQAILGALLTDRGSIDRIGRLITADFYTAGHRLIFQAVLDCHEAGEPCDCVAVYERLDAAGRAAQVGGLAYLGELARGSIVANIGHHARLVRDRAMERELLATLGEIGNYVYSAAPLADKLNLAQSRLMALGQQGGREADDMAVAVAALQDGLRRRAQGQDYGLSTGFPDLDRRLLAIDSGDLVIIAGRPSMGKSALAFQLAQTWAAQGIPGLCCSLEMSRDQLLLRMVCGMSRVPMGRLRAGHELDHPAVVESFRRISEWPLWIDAQGGLSLADVRAKARRAQRAHGIRWLLVDYLQLMSGRGENRNVIIGEISRGLKALAKELCIPVIALSQLSRKCEERVDKRPLLSDLRESGEIEQDADIVLFLHREEYYRPQSHDWQGLAEVLVRKLRQGEAGDVRLAWIGQRMRFEAFAGSWPENVRDISSGGFRK